MPNTLNPLWTTVLVGMVLTVPTFAQQVGPLPPSADPTLNVGTVGAQPVGGGSTALGASSGFDDFNRADGPLGADWTPMVNNFEIRNNQFANVGTANGRSLYNAAISLYENAGIEFDLTRNPTTLAYGAAIIGGGGSDNTFTKIQGSTTYTSVGFYHGSNGGSIGGYEGFFSITPVTGGRVRVCVTNAGDTMNADIDEDIDGVFEYHYESSGLLASGLAPLMGDGVGLGSYSDNGPVDNFSVNGAGPEPVLQVMAIVPDQFITFDISNLASGSTAVMVLSSIGPGPTNTPFGDIEVSFPWRQTPPFPRMRTEW